MQHEQHGAAAAVWAALAAIGATDADAGEWLAEEGGLYALLEALMNGVPLCNGC